MKYGFVRAFNNNEADIEKDALIKYGCDKIIFDNEDAKIKALKHFNKVFRPFEKDDTIVIYSFNNIGQHIQVILNLLSELADKDINLISIKDNFNLKFSDGISTIRMLSKVGYNMVMERTKAGLTKARARGRVGGRPPKLPSEKVLQALHMIDTLNISPSLVCAQLNINRSTLYRNLQKHKDLNKESIKAKRERKLEEELYE